MSQVQPSQQSVAGVIGNVQTHRTGNKWFVTIRPDNSQFDKNLWTSEQALAADLYGKIGQRLGFVCNVNPDQNDPSKNYWWIVGVVNPDQAAAPVSSLPLPPQTAQPGAAFPQPLTAPAPQPVPQQFNVPAQQPVVSATVTPSVVPMAQGPTAAEKEERIMRETASKVAGILISHVAPEARTLENVIDLSERLVAYYRHGVDGQQPQDDPQDIPF